MVLWFTKDNPMYLAAEYRLSTAKSDLERLKFELKKNEEDLARAESTVESIDTTLSYLRKYAESVSIREYRIIRDQRVYEWATVVHLRKGIPMIERNIRLVQAEIQELEIKIPDLRCKVLEFKRD